MKVINVLNDHKPTNKCTSIRLFLLLLYLNGRFSLPECHCSCLVLSGYRSDHQRLSDIFVQKGPYLKMYSTYIRQFDNNVALLDEQCRKNTAFATVVREFEVELKKGLFLH